MTTNVVWLALHPEIMARGYWDGTIIEDLLAGRVWSPAYMGPVAHTESLDGLDGQAAVVVLPGVKHKDLLDEVNAALGRLSRVLLIVNADEGSFFPWREVSHPDIRIWIQNPRPDRHDDTVRALPMGWSPLTSKVRDSHSGAKDINWFFGGQITHHRRVECVEQLRPRTDGELIETPGFLKGLPPEDYLYKLANAKIAPAPGGIVTPDSFRLFEALELGCIPLADISAGEAEVPGYWENLLGGGIPFPLIEDWGTMPAVMDGLLADWPRSANRVGSWWIGWKRKLARRFAEDMRWLGADHHQPASRLSVLMPTSPIPRHPDAGITLETLNSVRSRPELAGAEVLIMCDGVRDQQAERTANYEEYQARLLHFARSAGNVWPIRFEQHQHQAWMTWHTLGDVDRPAIMFVEHDTPLVHEIPFEKLIDCVCGPADLVRLHHETLVLDCHQHMMLDQVSKDVDGLPLRRTFQWSQRPHVVNTAFYRRILGAHFALPGELHMIEDRMHSVVEVAWRTHGLAGWERYRLWMYVPEGNIQRSVHLDGRGEDYKWVDR
jgi:hypothetical protein